LLYSPGHGDTAQQGTVWVEDLASHGYVVIAFASTYEAVGVEFPSNRLELECKNNPRRQSELVDCNAMLDETYRELKLRRMDAQFIVDKLSAFAASNSNPDAEQRELPDGLRASLDMEKIGIFGHSLGGALAPYALADDPRVDAGINLDGGSMLETRFAAPPDDLTPDEKIAYTASVLDEFETLGAGVGDKPFMIMGNQHHGAPTEGNDAAFYGKITGFKRFVQLAGSEHGTFTDSMWLYPQLATAGLIPWSGAAVTVEHAVGTILQDRAIAINRAYIRSFFDRSLKGIDDHLMDGESPQYPEVKLF
jgi:hypothetical protein